MLESKQPPKEVRKAFRGTGFIFPASDFILCIILARDTEPCAPPRPLLPPEEHYKEKLQRRCCKDGLREIPMPYSCTRRSLYITEGWECMRAFRYCCATYRSQEFNTEIPTTPLPITTAAPTTTARRIVPVVSYGRREDKIPLSRHNFGECMFPSFL